MKKKAVKDVVLILAALVALFLAMEFLTPLFFPFPGFLKIILLVLSAVFMLMVRMPLSYAPHPEALQALNNLTAVTVDRVFVHSWPGKYYVFTPGNEKAEKGLILYPGGFVDPRVYAPVVRAIAEQGYLAVIVGMPFDLASFGFSRANAIIRRYPHIKKWAIAGHSLGAWMACRFAGINRASVKGVVLWASCPSEKYRLDDTGLKVLHVHGTKDGIVTQEKLKGLQANLPADTVFVKVDGGNHTQFGCYAGGQQRFDNRADIAAIDQQKIITKATVQFLSDL